MNLGIQHYIGLALLAFAAYMWFVNRKPSEGNGPLDRVDDILDALRNLGVDDDTVKKATDQSKPDKIRLLKEFVGALDKEKDADKIEYIIQNFGLDFLKEHISDE